MAEILKFVWKDPALRRGRDVAERGACEIVIFPGVRYERWTESTPPAPAPKPAPKKRRRRRRG